MVKSPRRAIVGGSRIAGDNGGNDGNKRGSRGYTCRSSVGRGFSRTRKMRKGEMVF